MKKILIVEDEEILLKRFRQVFVDDGNFQVVTASDGKTAIDTAMAEKPDAILLDIILPKVHGLDVLKKIRGSSDWGRMVPVIILTNLSDSGAVAAAVQSETFDFLVKKDWQLDEIVGMVKDRLNMGGNYNSGSIKHSNILKNVGMFFRMRL